MKMVEYWGYLIFCLFLVAQLTFDEKVVKIKVMTINL